MPSVVVFTIFFFIWNFGSLVLNLCEVCEYIAVRTSERLESINLKYVV